MQPFDLPEVSVSCASIIERGQLRINETAQSNRCVDVPADALILDDRYRMGSVGFTVQDHR